MLDQFFNGMISQLEECQHQEEEDSRRHQLLKKQTPSAFLQDNNSKNNLNIAFPSRMNQ